jgi:hypothetical protein
MFNRTPDPVITITRQQYFNQLSKQGLITQQEADNAINGQLSDSFLDVLNTIDNITSRYTAEMLLSSSPTFYKGNPLLYYIGNHYGLTNDETDKLFNDAQSL